MELKTQKSVDCTYTYKYEDLIVRKGLCPFCNEENIIEANSLSGVKNCSHYKWVASSGGIRSHMTFEGRPGEYHYQQMLLKMKRNV